MRLIVLCKDKIVKAKENTKQRMEYKEIVKGTFYMQKQIFFFQMHKSIVVRKQRHNGFKSTKH